MSADNWTTCPKCVVKADAERVERGRKAAESYGKVPPSEYTRLLDAAAQSSEPEDTFREDYELGLVGSEFYVSYHGQCTECGFNHVFKHEEKLVP